MDQMIRVRAATVDDAQAIGRVHVRAWQRAYRGHMPDDYLDGLDGDQRADGWRAALERPRRPVVLVAERGAVVGFVSAGPAGGEGPDGEVYALNVDPDHWGSGAGRALLAAAEQRLAADGFVEAVLWVLPANERARRLYERAGWSCEDEHREMEVLGVTVPEVRYRRSLPGAPPGTGAA